MRNQPLIVAAQYIESPISSHRGNPLIEALPVIPDTKRMVKFLRRRPYLTPEMLSLPADVRAHEITDQLQDEFFEPFPENIELFQRIDRLIRRGYKHRNPLTPSNAARYEFTGVGHAQRIQLGEVRQLKQPPAGFGLSIVGVSGMGKTTAIDSIVSYYPQVIGHDKYCGSHLPLTQVVWVKLQAPPGGSMKALAHAFLEEVDRLSGTTYRKEYSRASLDLLFSVVANVAFQQGVGLIVIDEIQALAKGRSARGRIAVLDFLTTLKNVVGVPVVLVGTPAALSIVKDEFREARRGSSVGDFIWRRRPNDDAFDHFCRVLWQMQFVTDPLPYSAEIRNQLYHCSQGITDIVVKLFQESQVRAALNGSEKVTPQLLRKVMEEEFGMISSLLEASRNRETETCNDIDIPDHLLLGDPVGSADGPRRLPPDMISDAIDQSLEDALERVR